MYHIHEQKNWHEVGHSRYIIADKNGSFVLGTYSKTVAETCLQALESPANTKVAANTATNSAIMQCYWYTKCSLAKGDYCESGKCHHYYARTKSVIA